MGIAHKNKQKKNPMGGPDPGFFFLENHKKIMLGK